MSRNHLRKLQRYLPFVLLIASLLACTFAFGDVGNQNRYSSGSSSGGGDGDLGALIGYLIGLFIQDPAVGMVVLVILVIIILIGRFKSKKQASDPGYINQQVNDQANNDRPYDNTSVVADKIRQTDPAFSSEKFISWAQEVFMKIQQAWTDRDWKPIRPFESESLFSTHQQQLNEYIRLNKINVIEKVGIKHCSLKSFSVDGDKETIVVILNAVMRDYVIDAETKKVLESDPNRDWYMKYELTFIRKAGVKTKPGISNLSTTNCPCCGAPTEITSAGQCPYCGSIITTGEHDWVLNNLVGVNG